MRLERWVRAVVLDACRRIESLTGVSCTAVAFGYLEALSRVGDRGRVLEEQTRLRSLNNLLNRAGFQSHLYEDYVDVTLDLLGELADLVPSSTAESTLWERFNDADVSNAIIAHLRVRRRWASLLHMDVD